MLIFLQSVGKSNPSVPLLTVTHAHISSFHSEFKLNPTQIAVVIVQVEQARGIHTQESKTQVKAVGISGSFYDFEIATADFLFLIYFPDSWGEAPGILRQAVPLPFCNDLSRDAYPALSGEDGNIQSDLK
jgi:hypothetical protein